MPANLSPEYKTAEAAFRAAREPKERLECLREMLRAIPKHKGTEHLQGDIKARIKQLTEELAGPKKGGTRSGPALVIRPEGAAQIAVLGPPNSGKSSLVASLTGARAEAGPYPFTTRFPQPAMLPYEDIHFQLVDLPPMSRDHSVPWIVNSLQPADAALLVVDLSDPACVDRTAEALTLLGERRISLLEDWDAALEPLDPDADDYDPFAIRLPTLMVAARSDLLDDSESEIAVFKELGDFARRVSRRRSRPVPDSTRSDPSCSDGLRLPASTPRPPAGRRTWAPRSRCARAARCTTLRASSTRTSPVRSDSRSSGAGAASSAVSR